MVTSMIIIEIRALEKCWMINSINISEYNPDEPFTKEVAKRIIDNHGIETLDEILIARFKEGLSARGTNISF